MTAKKIYTARAAQLLLVVEALSCAVMSAHRARSNISGLPPKLRGRVNQAHKLLVRVVLEVSAVLPGELTDAAAPQKLARITNVADVPGEHWVEKYELRDKLGRWKRLKRIPGNHQYAPGHEEVAHWLRRMGVTHVEMMDGYTDPVVVKKGVHAIEAFVQLSRRVDKAME